MGSPFDTGPGAPGRGVGFNTDPQAGDWDQLAFEGHSLIERVRGENTDTDDAFAIYVQGVNQTTKIFNILKTGAIYTGSSNTAVLSATAGITLAAVAAGGAGAFALRYDATIKAFDNAAIPKSVGSVGTPGSSSLASRDDHVHAGGSAGATGGVPSLFFGTQNVAGTSGNYLDAASSVLLYDGTMPSNVSTSAASTGTSINAARRDHGHLLLAATFNAAGAESATDRQLLGYQSIGTVSGVATLNFALGATIEATLVASTAFTFANMITGGYHSVWLRYAGTFSPTFTDTIRWTGQTVPAFTAASGRYDMTSFYKHSDGTNQGTGDLGH